MINHPFSKNHPTACKYSGKVAGKRHMKRQTSHAQQVNQNAPIADNDTLPVDRDGEELVFRAQIIPENFEGFRADPNVSGMDILMETLRVLNPDRQEINLNDYKIFVAAPIDEKQRIFRGKPNGITYDLNGPAGNIINNGDFIFFVEATSKKNKLEIWIRDQKILVFDQERILIGRRDEKMGIMPDIDLTPYLNINALRISRKQAWLIEQEGRWFICLDENARSPVFLNEMEQLKPGINYEIVSESKVGFGGSAGQSYLNMTLRLSK